MADRKAPRYRWEAFTHGINLAVLLAAGAVSLYDPRFLGLAIPAELAMLWILPDLPPYRLWVDIRHAEKALADERNYYLGQLWGLHPREPERGLRRVVGWFVERPADNPDERVVNAHSLEFGAYLEMRQIVDRLRELVGVRGVHVTENDLAKFEQVINGYLRLLIACRPLERAVGGIDPRRLDADLEALDAQLAAATGPVRTALTERRQLLAQQQERLPRLEATLQLFSARADAIVQQLRNIHGQVLADPGINVNELLDGLMERQEAIADPLQLASADAIVDDFLRRKAAKSTETTEQQPPPPRPPRGRQRA